MIKLTFKQPELAFVEEENVFSTTIMPLTYGFGHTLGTLIKSALLKRLTGVAISSVTLQGKYPFIEEPEEVLMNIKEVRLDRIVDDEESREVDTYHIERSLNCKKRDVLRAGDIFPDDYPLVPRDKEYIIGTLNTSIKDRKMCLTAELGDGYLSAEGRPITINENGVTFLCDRQFTPVCSAEYYVEATYADGSMNNDKLTIKFCMPDATKAEALAALQSAMSYSAMILQTCTEICEKVREQRVSVEFKGKACPEAATIMGMPLSRMDISELFSVRTTNCLKRAGIFTVEELTDTPMKELHQIKGFGVVCEKEITRFCSKNDLVMK